MITIKQTLAAIGETVLEDNTAYDYQGGTIYREVLTDKDLSIAISYTKAEVAAFLCYYNSDKAMKIMLATHSGSVVNEAIRDIITNGYTDLCPAQITVYGSDGSEELPF